MTLVPEGEGGNGVRTEAAQSTTADCAHCLDVFKRLERTDGIAASLWAAGET